MHDIASSRSPEGRLEITFTHIISPHGCERNSGQLFSEFGKIYFFQNIGKKLLLIFFNGKNNSLSGPVHGIASSRSQEGRLKITFTHTISPHGCARNSGQLFSVFWKIDFFPDYSRTPQARIWKFDFPTFLLKTFHISFENPLERYQENTSWGTITCGATSLTSNELFDVKSKNIKK